ncbi:MAG: hypothetical protein HW409_1414 [candidate division NC10 bacterium]|nr:hypothetical protein [candidate division NC10 bacterium]
MIELLAPAGNLEMVEEAVTRHLRRTTGMEPPPGRLRDGRRLPA